MTWSKQEDRILSARAKAVRVAWHSPSKGTYTAPSKPRFPGRASTSKWARRFATWPLERLEKLRKFPMWRDITNVASGFRIP